MYLKEFLIIFPYAESRIRYDLSGFFASLLVSTPAFPNISTRDGIHYTSTSDLLFW